MPSKKKMTDSLPPTTGDKCRGRVDYRKLDVQSAKAMFEQINTTLNGLVDQVTQTLEEMTPYLAEMQALTSQRGAKKSVLKAAGIPKWSIFGKSFSAKLQCSFRTIQRVVKLHRDAGEGSTVHGPNNQRRQRPIGLTSRQQTALVEAQVAANDLVLALESSRDYERALASYKRAAVSRDKLDDMVNVVSREPDWKSMLGQLLIILEPHEGSLPSDAVAQIHSLRQAALATADQPQKGDARQKPSAQPKSPARAAASANTARPPRTVDAHDGAVSGPPEQDIPDEPTSSSLLVEPAVPVTITMCPPVVEIEGVGRSDRSLPDAEGYWPTAITKNGFEPNEVGKLVYVGKR
jgi:hypothetical protein